MPALPRSQPASKKRIIEDNFERYGKCYRIGGDEFCVLLKNTAREAACAEEFLRQLEKKRKELTFLPTVSCGSAPLSGEDVVAVKDQADRAMYHHKKARKERTAAIVPE